METRSGVITDTDQKELKDDISQQNVKYHNPASVTIKKDDGVIYIRIITGNGQTINIIKEKKN